MPVYRFACDSCGREIDRYIQLANYDQQAPQQRCGPCEASLRRVFLPPALKTTTRFMSGSNDGFGNDNFSRQIALARACIAGINVSGKKFHPGLCPKGDAFSPYAWYGDEVEAKQKALALGRSVEGSINATAPIRDEDLAAMERPYRVAPHVVADDVQHEIDTQHGGKATAKKRRELTQKYQDKHSGNPVPIGPVTLAPK
jgi:hypothetical protein